MKTDRMTGKTSGRAAAAALLFALFVGGLAAWADGIGWRTDGTGLYPDANPVTEWSLDSNVIWATEMPDRSNSIPAIVGDRLFVCAEPNILMCLRLSDGEILWQAPNGYTDVAGPDELADMQQKQAEYGALRKEIAVTANERRKVAKQLQDDKENADLKQQLQTLTDKLKQLQEQLKPYLDTWYVLPPAHNYNGYSSATPVSDGQHVWALFGNGVGCCYDMDGNRLWARPIEKPRNDYGFGESPVLADGKLIVHYLSLKALDPLTGEEIWSQQVPAHWGTPAVTEIAGTTVLITPNGFWVNATDGAKLAQGKGMAQYATPVIHDGAVYFADGEGAKAVWRAFRLPETLDPSEPELIWEVQPKNDRYYGSPVIHDGIIYGVTRAQVLSALDLATGETIYQQQLVLGKGECFSSPTLAGGYILIGADSGMMAVIRPGRTYDEVAINSLETFRSSPVFVGNRMYLRGFDHMFCIGAQ